MKKIKLDVVSDVMCPWCYIGKRRLEQAIKMAKDIEVLVHWRPFQLDPTIPPEGRDRRQYLEDKFGGKERAAEIYTSIEQAGLKEGIDFQFNKIKLSPNTINAHRLIRWSMNEGYEVHNNLVELLFVKFFIEGENINDLAVLTKVAEMSGMDHAIVEVLFATNKDKEEVENEILIAQQMGITGVPCFIIENKFAVMGAQEPKAIADAIHQAADANESVTLKN